jgi:hypothetical protein
LYRSTGRFCNKYFEATGPPSPLILLVCEKVRLKFLCFEFALGVSVAGDTINLISLAGTPITFFESGLTIPHDLAIVGAGMLQTEIDAQDTDRVFSINVTRTSYASTALPFVTAMLDLPMVAPSSCWVAT